MLEDKATEIEDLNKSLKPPKELGGNFIPDGFKKQFDFMFIAEIPSMRGLKNDRESRANDNFKGDKLLTETMVKCGVGGSYVTDIVKERGVPGRLPTDEQIEKWLGYLLKEIEIIKPRYIVVLGKGNYLGNFKTWVEPRIDKSIKVDWVFHYAMREPRKKEKFKTKKEKFEMRFSEVVSEFKNASSLS